MPNLPTAEMAMPVSTEATNGFVTELNEKIKYYRTTLSTREGRMSAAAAKEAKA